MFTITPHRPDHRRHHCVLLVVPMFEYGNHAVAITKAFLAHTFLTATFWKVPIPKRYPSFSDFPLFLGPRAPLVQPSIGPSVRSSVSILYDDDQRRKNLGSRVALLPGKFLRVRKVFARITEKPFKLSQYFQND